MRQVVGAVLFGVLGTLVLIGLGLWQLDRMDEKRAYLDLVQARIGTAPIALPASPSQAEHNYQAVEIEGRLTGEYLEVLSGQRGDTPGVRIIEVLELAGGRRVLMDRGFLVEEARKTPRPAKAVKTTGNLIWPQDADSFTPPPDAKTGLWFARDLPAMAAKLQTEATLIVAREQTGGGIEPVPVDASGIPNNHWGYAIQWFLMAIAWGVMTLYLLWRIWRRTA